jgi:hypothetical protein
LLEQVLKLVLGVGSSSDKEFILTPLRVLSMALLIALTFLGFITTLLFLTSYFI